VDLQFVRLERSDGLARVTLDRPPLNILDIPMLDELRQLFRSLDGHPRPTAVLITGAGKAFCAGVSVEDHTADRVDAMIHSFHRVIEQVLALPCPVIAALNGAALGGGCELALACDTVLARGSADSEPWI
jgi:cyclohexa-1,5-dienecarbonyl-CoA hydratase